MENSVCSNCTKDPVCYIPKIMPESEKYFGFCDECNKCPICDNKVMNRIYWSSGNFKLYTDRCDKHVDITDCNCSKNATNIVIVPYIYS